MEAKRLLDEMAAHVSADVRASMLKNIRVNREIQTAWDSLDSRRAKRVEEDPRPAE